MKSKTTNNIEDIIYLDELQMPRQSGGVVWTLQQETFTSTSYIINLDKDVTDPHHYREIVQTLLTMGENDVANWNINTWGGDLYTTIMLIDAIRQCQGSNYGIVTLGSSAGSFLALALDDCEVIPHGEMFLHEVQSGNYGSNSNQEKRILFMKEKQRRFIEDIYEDFLTKEEMEYIQNNGELWLSDEDCNERLEKRRKIRVEKMKAENDIQVEGESVDND